METVTPTFLPLQHVPPTQIVKSDIPRVEHVELTAPVQADLSTTTEKLKPSDPFTNVKTTAFVVEKPGADFTLMPVTLDEVRPDEVLIEMKYSGICHTDIVLQQGLLPMVEFPAVFGHEGAGIIRSIGTAVKNKTLRIGQAVLLSFNTCGTCKACISDHPAFCHVHPQVNHNAVRLGDRTTPGTLSDGRTVRTQYFGQSSFSKMSVVNEKCVVPCADAAQLDIYAPIGCGFQTGAGTILNVLKPKPQDSLIIFGLGGVGLAALMAAKYLEVDQIIAVDITDSRLELARELGATHTINSKTEGDVVSSIKKLTGGGATFAVECTGIPKVLEDVIASVGPQGTAALVGVAPANAKVSIDPLTFLLENKKLVGVIEGDSNPPDFIPKLIAMHRAGQFPIDKLCKTYPATQLQEAIHDMHMGKVIKPVIDWET